ncbi:hypothetical protein GCM10009039_29010 [Halocalculus aciditolerans]|uniref:Uncharacterized protein n=2 Tax=Halocalculus aciditolerans TaxID=1383812 RepID=A0A830FF99_9EURY|nr:hypothetical protein GCM10009039_29010 [Halocalculus aciditolerans]
MANSIVSFTSLQLFNEFSNNAQSSITFSLLTGVISGSILIIFVWSILPQDGPPFKKPENEVDFHTPQETWMGSELMVDLGFYYISWYFTVPFFAAFGAVTFSIFTIGWLGPVLGAVIGGVIADYRIWNFKIPKLFPDEFLDEYEGEISSPLKRMRNAVISIIIGIAVSIVAGELTKSGFSATINKILESSNEISFDPSLFGVIFLTTSVFIGGIALGTIAGYLLAVLLTDLYKEGFAPHPIQGTSLANVAKYYDIKLVKAWFLYYIVCLCNHMFDNEDMIKSKQNHIRGLTVKLISIIVVPLVSFGIITFYFSEYYIFNPFLIEAILKPLNPLPSFLIGLFMWAALLIPVLIYQANSFMWPGLKIGEKFLSIKITLFVSLVYTFIFPFPAFASLIIMYILFKIHTLDEEVEFRLVLNMNWKEMPL